MTHALCATGLHKRFGTTSAIAGVDVQAAPGECVGLVGSNGGGRSTLLRLLATLLRPTAGTIEIDGLDASRHLYEVRRRIAYVGESLAPGHGLCVRDYLTFLSSTRSAATRARRMSLEEALVRAGVTPDADVDVLSSGQRRRVALAGAFLLEPRVLLLDDPFCGLDADARTTFSVWLSEVRNAGTAIVAALNEERDVRALCHRVVRLEAGRLVSAVAQPSSDGRYVPALAETGAV
ncbi:MAG TPA: ATP-binding cassette domain-containing protein [Vicinamibacterales bacterium]|nr:ATP-binding cassette domain-containing protein [Vicinamibacterales bacterium]